MSMHEQLRNHLLQDAAVAALVGTRLYPFRLPKDPSYPCITSVQVSGVPTVTLDGDAGSTRVRMQLDCWDETYAGAHILAEAVRTALKSTPFNCMPNGVRDLPEDEITIYRVSMDFSCWKEA